MSKNQNGTPATDEHWIVERIFAAVMEQRLPPNTKLSEAALCEGFGVGRTRVRRALLLLANQGIVVLHSNRGAFIASPTPREARNVFEARRSIEPEVVRHAVERASAQDTAALEAHLRREHVAHEDRDRREAIRLSGEFHIELAATTGNEVMTRMVKELVTRTSLIIALFGAPGVSNCPDDEHAEILSAIRLKEADRAVLLMRQHLDHIEAELNLAARQDGKVDIRAVLRT